MDDCRVAVADINGPVAVKGQSDNVAYIPAKCLRIENGTLE